MVLFGNLGLLEGGTWRRWMMGWDLGLLEGDMSLLPSVFTLNGISGLNVGLLPSLPLSAELRRTRKCKSKPFFPSHESGRLSHIKVAVSTSYESSSLKQPLPRISQVHAQIKTQAGEFGPKWQRSQWTQGILHPLQNVGISAHVSPSVWFHP